VSGARILGSVAWLAAASLGAAACGEERNVCRDARDKVEACDAQAGPNDIVIISPLFKLGNDSCTSEDACASACFLQMTCDELRRVFSRNTDPNRVPSTEEVNHSRCVWACWGEEDIRSPDP
jgi:hypothetical protein